MPVETRKLFRSLTVIVIDSRIRPSYFNSTSAAIYLDPDILWIKATELASMDKSEDYRASYSEVFDFFYAQQYVDDNEQAAWYNYADDYPRDRPAAEVLYATSALLFHELAHVNDFYPYEIISSTPTGDEVPEDLLAEEPSSALLDINFPLSSDQLYAYAGVVFHGEQASSEQLDFIAEDIGALLQADVASDIYAYSHPAEDLAMLFEEFAMLFFLNMHREITIVNIPEFEYDCLDLEIAWGQSARITNPQILERVLFVSTALMPDLADEFSSFAELLDGPTPIGAGQNWCDWFFDY